MSIVALQRVALVGRERDRDAILRELQRLGRMHVLRDEPTPPLESQALEVGRRVLRELEAAPMQRRPLADWRGRDADTVAERVLTLREERLNLQDERDRLQRDIERLLPWGDFHTPAPETLGGLRLYFYTVPLYRLDELAALALPWREIGRDNVTARAVVIAREPPQDVPGAPQELGDRSLSELRERVERVDERIDEIAAERADLTRWRGLLERHYLARAEAALLEDVRRTTADAYPLFVLRGYWPVPDLETLRALRQRFALSIVEEPVPEGEQPPTLLENEGLPESGQSLVTFYTTPAAGAWDPSGLVMVSFALFFAMILSDAGYALVLIAITLLLWKRLSSSRGARAARRMLATIGLASAAWGVTVGSYFGVAPPADGWLAALARLDVGDADRMMALSVWIGAAHLVLANVLRAYRLRGDTRALAPLGWCALIAAGLLAWQAATDAAWVSFGLGLLLVLGFTAPAEGALGRLIGGVKGLAGVTGAFGDVLSYLRLFALGLASASLAGAFNDLAAEARGGTLGLLSAVFILLIGHTLNMALGVMGGFVHGLRLNFIEFFKWGLEGEGHPYRPFALLSPDREESPWKT